MDNAPSRPSVAFVQQVPTMNIRTSITVISEIDPLKKVFAKVFKFLPPNSRGHVVAALGELIGTIFFLFMAFAAAQVAFISSNTTTQGNISTEVHYFSPAELLYIAIGAGFSLAVTAWTFFRISGGLFNPIVSSSCCCFT
jgi:aquaporin related protein